MISANSIHQPEYEENLFGSLPDGALFQIPGDNHLWEKDGNTAVRNFVPSNEMVQRRRRNLLERDAHPRQPKTVQVRDEHMQTGWIKRDMEPEKSVDVCYIPGTEEIHDRLLAFCKSNTKLNNPDASTLRHSSE